MTPKLLKADDLDYLIDILGIPLTPKGEAIKDEWFLALPDATPAPSGWQPISSAPKDGRMLLLYPSPCWADDTEGDYAVGYWDKDSARWDTMTVTAEDYTGPTHWQPLPAAPSLPTPAETIAPDLQDAERRLADLMLDAESLQQAARQFAERADVAERRLREAEAEAKGLKAAIRAYRQRMDWLISHAFSAHEKKAFETMKEHFTETIAAALDAHNQASLSLPTADPQAQGRAVPPKEGP